VKLRPGTADEVHSRRRVSHGYLDLILMRQVLCSCMKDCRGEEEDLTTDHSTKYSKDELIVNTDEITDTYSLTKVDIASSPQQVFNINFYSGDSVARRGDYQDYYELCKRSGPMQVTTSCFTAWRKSKKINGAAKVIPAVLPSTASEKVFREAPWIFFFDDNLEWGGAESSPGICNLRDVTTGDFIEFAEGKNGFTKDRAARHTVIHYSKECKIVLVKANILDAMEDQHYFMNIVERYVGPEDKALIYMDVNATIICADTIQGKDFAVTLLATMFEFLDFRPHEGFSLQWGDVNEHLKIDKPKGLKSIVKELTMSNHREYSAFWNEQNCWDFFTYMATKGQVKWVTDNRDMSLDSLRGLFEEYRSVMRTAASKEGITKSWFHLVNKMKVSHRTILNSFGVDTRKVLKATLSDDTVEVMQVVVNYEMWDDRDVKKYAEQFVEKTEKEEKDK